MDIAVLFVDDEPDIRASFRTRFQQSFPVFLAANGKEALGMLKGENSINVVVTDIRMPQMNGLELLKECRAVNPDLGFIMVSGHGDSDEIVTAFRLGARNFLRKPYRFAELEQAIVEEARRYELLRERHKELESTQAAGRYLRSIEKLVYELPTSLDWVNSLSTRLVNLLELTQVCDEESRPRVMLGLVEIFTNAVEHGNLSVSGPEKQALKAKGERVYMQELHTRMGQPPFRDRKVTVTLSINDKAAAFTVRDEGQGFDFSELPDPTDAENLFKSSGRGILLARAFLDEVRYEGNGNTVTLVKHRPVPKPS
jgi:DNA-binding response OmpR family regulator